MITSWSVPGPVMGLWSLPDFRLSKRDAGTGIRVPSWGVSEAEFGRGLHPSGAPHHCLSAGLWKRREYRDVISWDRNRSEKSRRESRRVEGEMGRNISRVSGKFRRYNGL